MGGKAIFSRNGLTLLEIVITTAMIGLVGLSFFAIYTATHRFMLQSTVFASSNSEATYAMEHIRRNLTRANLVNIYSNTSVGFRYDHRTGAAATPNNVDDDEWDYYGLNGTTLMYRRDFVPGAVAGGGVPADPGAGGGEVVARNILPPGGAIADLFQAQNNGAWVTVSLTARQATGQQLHDTSVVGRVNPRGVPNQ